MEIWQTLLINGNDNFDNKQWTQAHDCYQQAVECLDVLCSQDKQNFNLLMAWISGLHNLSALYEAQGKSRLAMSYLMQPHQRLIDRSQAQQLCSSAQLLVLRGLNITFSPIVALSKKYPNCVSCQEALPQAQALMRLTQPTTH